MKNGLAMWHYPHRSTLENLEFFVAQGFEAVSFLGTQMLEVCADGELSARIKKILDDTGTILTVHHKLPRDHAPQSVADFKSDIDAIGRWQRKYGSISILSFDVPATIKDNVLEYVDYVLSNTESCKVALEDFGLNENERVQLRRFDGNERFGHLVDLGHELIRICNVKRDKAREDGTLEKEITVEKEDFIARIREKDFPIFEIHLHSNDGVKDLHQFLDDGKMDVGVAAEVVLDIGFDGVLTIESAPGFMFKCEYPESDERILQTYEIWKAAYRKALS